MVEVCKEEVGSILYPSASRIPNTSFWVALTCNRSRSLRSASVCGFADLRSFENHYWAVIRFNFALSVITPNVRQLAEDTLFILSYSAVIPIDPVPIVQFLPLARAISFPLTVKWQTAEGFTDFNPPRNVYIF